MKTSTSTKRAVTAETRQRLERLCLGVALVGLLMMVQPVTRMLFRPGFLALFVAGIAYVSTTFWRPEGLTARGIVTTLLWTFLTVLGIIALAIWLAPRLL
ncbi:hypothetical protein HN371_02345 [Candidatus Poribacteria bacterium]|jgi:hypothetical protein|nr:hypothetical protein [Candidatus Poribacteria bacterium]MBT5537018.1 hypothetical protein [Candidatus Poribacteria bacterium]MBT5712887.1 hypothetical protein [Candidatus Poribacteria bacterium]MBT7099457.1 hypothetical protein [Candidatus Poribacteria bacterium]MBT7804988.1 hypothetical protein [Candidatus Poribacteria bacterium]